MSPETLPLFAAWPLLGAMALGDLRELRIPNRLLVALAAVFALVAPFTVPAPEIGLRVLAAACIFVLCVAAFAAGVVGGGDAKALPILTLFVPVTAWTAAPSLFALSLLAGILAVLALRRTAPPALAGWKSLATPRSFPMGVSFALCGVLLSLTHH
ncbi:prepilin peptidase [Roseivivax marinus]|uniref:prepilin peptidase n=1 Tax=Roseivivax marinus TaxID=1379903 RepID=UPI00273F5D6D|nr:prepilin peptidase [Roseivivax marinus]